VLILSLSLGFRGGCHVRAVWASAGGDAAMVIAELRDLVAESRGFVRPDQI